MLVICFEHNGCFGGLGDRIVGLISVKLMSKLLNKKFYILWNKENIHDYINYEKYDFELFNTNGLNIMHYNYVDNQTGLKEYLMLSNIIFPDTINKFYLNQEISQYLYKNRLFTNNNYINDIMNEYKSLYIDILKPTDSLIKKINNYTENKNNIIGIQIRCGDIYMVTNKNEAYNTNIYENIDNILLNIKKDCDEKYDDYNIFLTSDYDKVYDKCLDIWDKKQIIYNNDLIQHIDREAINNDISKIFIDNFILSQRTVQLYISEISNFGRIAALSCIHDNIYGLNCNFLIKSMLLSKHEIL